MQPARIDFVLGKNDGFILVSGLYGQPTQAFIGSHGIAIQTDMGTFPFDISMDLKDWCIDHSSVLLVDEHNPQNHVEIDILVKELPSSR